MKESDRPSISGLPFFLFFFFLESSFLDRFLPDWARFLSFSISRYLSDSFLPLETFRGTVRLMGASGMSSVLGDAGGDSRRFDDPFK